MAIGGFIHVNHQTSVKSTALNLIPGVVWGIGNLFMFYSQPKVGVATSFSLSQLLVIVSIRWDFYFRRKRSCQMIGIWSVLSLLLSHQLF